MQTYQIRDTLKKSKQVLIYSSATMIMTIIHHFYGAYIYKDDFRLHVAIIAIPLIILYLVSYFAFRLSQNKFRKRIFNSILIYSSLVFSCMAIGIYEGGYNHLVKNILYFSGSPISFLNSIYTSNYQLPDDLFFEVTGLMQFVLGLTCGIIIIKFFKGGNAYIMPR